MISKIIFALLILSKFLFSNITFNEISESAGVSFPMNAMGVCLFDYNNDGWDDIFVANQEGDDLLFQNNGDMTFEEISVEAEVHTSGASKIALPADYDADGYLDLFVGVANNLSKLYHNEGNGTFIETSIDVGIQHNGNINGGSWGDYNDDGWIDLYIVNFGQQNFLYENNNGSFEDITQDVGAQGPMNDLNMMAVFFDYNNDGVMEILGTQDGYRGNYLLEMQMYGLYANIASQNNILANDLLQGMGMTISDYNRDGWLDVYFSNLHQNMLFRNNGNNSFTDVSLETGAQDPFASMTWGTNFLDADNDGWQDIYNNNLSGFAGVGNTFFKNLGDGTFIEAASDVGLFSFNNGYGSAVSDLDHDGDIDIIAVGHSNSNGLLLYRNDTPLENHWSDIILSGNYPNNHAIGVMLNVWTEDEMQTSYIHAGCSYLSQDSFTQHFGLGIYDSIDSVVVHWPSQTTHYYNIPSGLIVTLFEDSICYPSGDTTFDNTLDILDIVACVSYIISDFVFDEYQLCLSDMTQDNQTDILDIVAMVNIVVNQSTLIKF